MEWALGILLLLLIAGRIAWPIWKGRVLRRRIRQWATDSGYALLRLRYQLTPGRLALLLFVGWIPFFPLGAWYIKIQDEQGGQRDGYVHFGSWLLDVPWGEMHVRWL